jgi:hypothetical protein
MKNWIAVAAVLVAGSFAMADTMTWNFESGMQGWTLLNPESGCTTAVVADNRSGSSVLQLAYPGGDGSPHAVVDLNNVTTQVGATLTMDLRNGGLETPWAGQGRCEVIQIYMVDSASNQYVVDASAFYNGAWHTYAVPLSGLGIADGTQITRVGVWTNQCDWWSPTDIRIDNVSLTGVSVPEPMTLATLAIGALGLLRRKK